MIAIGLDNFCRIAPSGVIFRPIDTGIRFQYEAAWKAERSSPAIAAFLKITQQLTGLK